MKVVSPHAFRRLAVALVGMALTVVAPASDASPLDLFGFGGRTPGMGGAGVASADNFEALYVNPAGLGKVRSTSIALGGLYGDFHLEIDDREQSIDPALGTVFGAVAPLQLGGVLKDRVALGLGVFVPTKALARAKWPVTGEPVFALLDSRSQVVGMQFGLGFMINEQWQAGVSVLALAGLGGTIFISSDAVGRFTSRSEQELIARAAPIFGVRYAPTRDWDLGLVLRAESDATFDVKIENDLENELPLTIPTLNITGIAQFDPLTLAVEGAWQLQPNLSAHGQLAYQRWSEFEPPVVNPVEGATMPASPDFHDTVVPRVGVEWSVRPGQLELDVRGGYGFFWSPAPKMDGEQSLLDNHRHVLSTGLGLAWPGMPFRFDFWAQAHFLQPRSHQKDPAKFSSPDDIPFAGELDTDGRIIVGGATLGVEL